MVNTFEEMGKTKLRQLLTQCTNEQQNMFNRIYKSVDTLPMEKIDCAIQLVERTIEKNEEKSNG